VFHFCGTPYFLEYEKQVVDATDNIQKVLSDIKSRNHCRSKQTHLMWGRARKSQISADENHM